MGRQTQSDCLQPSGEKTSTNLGLEFEPSSSVELSDLDAKMVSAAWALVISNNVAIRLPEVIESQFSVRLNIFNPEITK